MGISPAAVVRVTRLGGVMVDEMKLSPELKDIFRRSLELDIGPG